MDNLYKSMPTDGKLGKEVLRIKKRKKTFLFLGILTISAAIYYASILIGGGTLVFTYVNSSLRIPLPNPVAWILVLSALGFGINFVYRALFKKLEVVFYQYGLETGEKSFFYHDLTDIEYLMKKNAVISIRITGDSISYTQQLDDLKKEHKKFIENLSEFLKSDQKKELN